jgi:hypothetical protein
MFKGDLMSRSPLVLLFCDGYELKALPGLSGKVHSDVHAPARYLYRSALRKQVWTGFYSALALLRLALERAGCDVRVNDFETALRYPDYMIGLANYPSVLSKVVLRNPVICGPGDYGFPDEAAELASQQRFRRFIQPSPWAARLYEGYCGAKMAVWPVGVDTGAWPDLSKSPKTLEVLIYDKIRWNYDEVADRLLGPITRHLDAAGLTNETIRYGHYYHADYLHALRRARAMIFLCEHETQGLACEEAMSCNVPVLAWDDGILVDPQYRRFLAGDIRVSSVPYFDDRCGARFRSGQFEAEFSTFWGALDQYEPRSYVEERLSLARSAKDYLKIYLEHA